MICPRCKTALEARERDGIRISACPACGGSWIGGAALHAVFGKDSNTSRIEEALESFHDVEFHRSLRPCPACRGKTLKAVMVDEIELDYCLSCKGLFFDPGELEQLFPAAGATPASVAEEEDDFWAIILRITGGKR